MADLEDFWGADFHTNDVESAPVSLLTKQANLLSKKTGGRVLGDVKQQTSPDGTVSVSLYARVPGLKDYEHKLISITHPLVRRNPQLPFPLTAVDTRDGAKIEIDDMSAFRDWLKTTLSSSEVHATIENLMRYGGGAMASASMSG